MPIKMINKTNKNIDYLGHDMDNNRQINSIKENYLYEDINK